MASNANLPPLQVKVLNRYLDGNLGYSSGTLISVRSLMNQALQVSVLLESGALYTGLPMSALCDTNPLPLTLAQAYDCIGSDIEVITLDVLRYMKCSVKFFNGDAHKGMYMFTIDFVDNNGLARHPTQWKQFHVIKLDSGHWVAYPQYRVMFLDDALCPNHRNDLPHYNYNETVWLAE